MYIVSMTTVPCRKERLKENLGAILNQTYKFDKLVINVDDNLTDEDYAFYNELAKTDDRIEIGICDAKWRSCNKLLPTIQKYPEDVVITVDDDVMYPHRVIQKLVERYEMIPSTIIAHEVNPVIVDMNTKKIRYFNGFDVKLGQTEYGKYLSNCTLYPPHCFDGTDLYDYDKMMKCTQGTHDELWFWIQSTLNHVKCIGLDYVWTFYGETKHQYEPGEYRLSSINEDEDKITEYFDLIHEVYGDKLYDIITTDPAEFFVGQHNVQLFIQLSGQIRRLYNYGFTLHMDKDLTVAWRNLITNIFVRQ